MLLPACVVGTAWAVTTASGHQATPRAPQTARLKVAPVAHAAAVRGLRYVAGNVVTAYPAGDTGGVIVSAWSQAVCPRGLHALGGGWNSADTTTDRITISSNTVGRGLNRWIVVAEDTATATANYTPTDFTFQATVMCG